MGPVRGPMGTGCMWGSPGAPEPYTSPTPATIWGGHRWWPREEVPWRRVGSAAKPAKWGWRCASKPKFPLPGTAPGGRGEPEPSPLGVKGLMALGLGCCWGGITGLPSSGVGQKGEGWSQRHPVTSPRAGSGLGAAPPHLARITGVKTSSAKASSPHPFPAPGP